MTACANHQDRKAYSRGLCKSCYHKVLREENPAHAAKQKAYFAALYASNPDPKKLQSANWSIENRAKKSANDARYRKENYEACRVKQIAWKKANFHKVLANNAARRARTSGATPAWANKQDIADAYLEARHMQMHVDHVIPLIHPLVCGLHVWDNLQLLTPAANLRKNNKFDPETHHGC